MLKSALIEETAALITRGPTPGGIPVEPENVYAYGSSGGGYAALRSALYRDGLNVIAINPQTQLAAYGPKWTRRFAQNCYGRKKIEDIAERYQGRFTALDPQILKNARHIFYAQNTEDQEHMDNHFNPFLNFVAQQNADDRLTVHTFADPPVTPQAKTKRHSTPYCTTFARTRRESDQRGCL
ncbi:hypothetical protein [Nesterenkonia sp. NBAIMH1]|uniref:hypothetical protein n=1 Tax=Nesterenkonia sp. NBAIMH1 TaxID=2600320 RepID=UPI0011B4F29A|nr:hypothetical protein [Nesterenkonia sp. NBAIMH1]